MRQGYCADDLAETVLTASPQAPRPRARRPSAGPIARYAPSSALRAMPRPSPCAAQKSPSAPPFAIQPSRAHQVGVDRAASPPTSSGRARIASRIRCGVRVSSTAAPARVVENVGTPQPSTATWSPPMQLGDPQLQRVRSVAIRVQRPAVRPAGGEHAGVLARAVVAELPFGPPRLQPVLQVIDGDAGAREHLPHRGELRWLRTVGRARDRDLVVVQVVVALHERDRLDRLRRGPEEERQLAVAPALAVRRRCVDSVDRLNEVSAPHLDGDRLHRGNLVPWKCRRRSTPVAAT